jgi:two-component sensor histidine kinase
MLNYSAKDGLPSNIIYEIYRDSKGFLWFATDKGIARYNGIQFETFTTNNGLPDNEVFFFQEDKYGRLWLASYNGEVCYYQDGIFHNASNTPFLKIPFKASFIQNIVALPDSSVFIHFTNQSTFLNITKNKCRVLSIKDFPPYFFLIGVTNLPDSGFKLTYNASTAYINKKNEIVKNVTNARAPLTRLFGQNTYYLYNDSVIFASNEKVVARFKPNFLDKYTLYRIYSDGTNMFFGTNNSLIINDSIEILKGNKVSSITQDSRGNYWVSTAGNGAFVIKKNFLDTKYLPNIYNGVITYAFAHKNQLFFSTAKHLYHLEGGQAKIIMDYSGYEMLPQNIMPEPALLIDTGFRFFRFSAREAVVVQDLLARKKKVSTYHYIKNVLKSLAVIGDDVYIKGMGEILKFNLNHPTASEKEGIPEVCHTNNRERVFGMDKSADGKVWYSTVSNLYKIENNHEQAQPQFKKYLLKHFRFFGPYMLGYTHSNQLLLCTGFNETLAVDSIPSQNCIWDRFYALGSNRILISTNNLYRLLTINPPGSVPKFSVSIIEAPFIPLQADYICADSNSCFFFKGESITSIDIKSIFSKPAPPSVVFKTLKAGAKEYPIGGEVELPYYESRAIAISFSTLSFSGKNVFYQYSISKGPEDNWRDIVGDINLAQVGYGTYLVKIRARSYSSDNCTPVAFTLHVLHPYWATWWFVALLICIIIVTIAIIVRYRIVLLLHRKEKQHKSEVRFIKSEFKSLNALMNPHFIFNTLNNVQYLINKNDKLAANEYLRVFADLIRQNMHNVSKELIPLQEELSLVRNYLLLEKLRFEDKLNYSIEIDNDIDLSEIFVPPLLVQPLVENSIKHGILHLKSSDGFVSVQVYDSSNILYIKVKDNGVGMNFKHNTPSGEHESFGLDNIRKRIEQLSVILNKQLSFHISEEKSEEGALLWTVVTISLPLN